LRERGLDAIAQINVHAGCGVSLLFHAAESKTVKCVAGEKISQTMRRKLKLRNAETISAEWLILDK
jgi:hypothetical protein